MRLWSLLGNGQRLDGGAMFGNAPRALWQRWAEPDGDNRIRLACRALLCDDGRLILFEAGIGAFFPPDMRLRYGVEEPGHVLLEALGQAGFTCDDVELVVLSHLHFDHAGGILAAHEPGAPPRLCFPRARFLVSEAAWQRACAPHARDRASFIAELPALLEASGRLEIVRAQTAHGLSFHFSDGHTPGLMLAELATARGPLVFASDLVPGSAWVHAPITMGYDRFPEKLVDEKLALCAALSERGGSLFFTHDPDVAAARIVRDERGRFSAAEPITAFHGETL